MLSPIDPRKVFVVIPAFNEQQSLQFVVDELITKRYNPVIIDDGSANDIYSLIKGGNVYFLRHRVNLGQGAALQTGIEFALHKQASYIVTFDADGQHHANDIEQMLAKLEETGSDIVLGSRFMKSNAIPLTRRIILQTARYVNFLFTGLFLTDAHNGLRALTKEAAEKITITENRMAHATEILSLIRRNKLKYVEVPVNVSYTEYSQQKGQSAIDSFRIFFDLLLNKIFR